MRSQEKGARVALVDPLMTLAKTSETIAWFRALLVKRNRCGCKEEKASMGLVTDQMWRKGEGGVRTTHTLCLSN